MSNWVHLAGIIRIGRDQHRAAKEKAILKKIFCLDIKETYDEIALPNGSEGPISININNDGFSYAISIYGDLRGRDEEYLKYIKTWWNSVEQMLKNNNFFICDGILHIIIDYPNKDFILSYT